MNINTQINKISENLGTVLSSFKDDIASKATEQYVDDAISGKADIEEIPSAVSQLENDLEFATEQYVDNAISGIADTPIVDVLSSETFVNLEQNKEYHHTPANDVTYMFGSGPDASKTCEWNIIVDHANDINITWGYDLITGELIGSYTPAQGDIVLYHCFWYAPSFKVKIMPIKIN